MLKTIILIILLSVAYFIGYKMGYGQGFMDYDKSLCTFYARQEVKEEGLK
jgi:hypothetical protein